MSTLKNLLIAEVERRLFAEGVPRIKKCLNELTEEEIWFRPNENSNSVGNLVLHLCGNVRQWLLAGLGNQKDVRKRQLEFDEKGPIPVAELIQLLDKLENDVRSMLPEITEEGLAKNYSIQGFEENGVSVLVHVAEHFSYHVGQITYFTKWKKNMDTAYYSGADLDITSPA